MATQREILLALLNAIEADSVELEDDVVTLDDLAEYAENQLTILDSKNERARAVSAKKRQETDALRAAVKETLTNKYQTGDQILSKVTKNGEYITKMQVVSRLTDLIKYNEAKKSVRVDDYGHRVVMYKLLESST